jgi:D-3-phosphoglycerate dehydrogenase
MKKLLVTDGLKSEGREILEASRNLFAIKYFDRIATQDLESEIETADVLLIRTATKITESLLKRAKNLKLIVRAGVGVDHIDLKAASQRQIAVANTPAESADTVAEFTLGMIISAARKIPQSMRAMQSADWSRESKIGFELKGKTAGIFGFGRIGSRVALRLKAFEMNILACDPYIPKADAERYGILLVDFETLLKKSDILSIHTPLTSETRKLFNHSVLQRMKKNALLVNCARGEIVIEEDILEALKSKHLFGYAADVFEAEPLDPTHPFLSQSNIVLSPHIGAQTEEAQVKVSIAAAQQIVQYFKSGEIKNRVVEAE